MTRIILSFDDTDEELALLNWIKQNSAAQTLSDTIKTQLRLRKSETETPTEQQIRTVFENTFGDIETVYHGEYQFRRSFSSKTTMNQIITERLNLVHTRYPEIYDKIYHIFVEKYPAITRDTGRN